MRSEVKGFHGNRVAITVSQWNQIFWMVWKTFVSTNSHLFALLCHFGMHESRKFLLESCRRVETLNYKLPTLGDFLVPDQEVVPLMQDSGSVVNSYL